MSRYKRVGDVPSGRYFRLSTEEADQTWFRVRRHVEDYTEIQHVESNGDLGPYRLIGEGAMVVPLAVAGTKTPQEIEEEDMIDITGECLEAYAAAMEEEDNA
jgi:hypothetical protein